MANSTECKSCGFQLNSRQSKCPYCGSANPNVDNSANRQQQTTSGANSFGYQQAPYPQQNPYQQQYRRAPKTQKKFSVGIFVLLLIFFWPAAIVYAVINAS